MKIDYLLGSLAIPFVIFIIILSYILANHFTGFSIFKNSISELGCKEFTPCYLLFNIGVMISGFLLIFLFHGIVDMLVYGYPSLKMWFRIAWVFFVIGSLGMSGIGIFTIEVNEKAHLYIACVAFGSIAIGEVIIGITLLKQGSMTLFPMIIMPIFIVVAVLFIVLGTRVPLIEWVFFVVIMLWGLPLVVDFYKEVFCSK